MELTLNEILCWIVGASCSVSLLVHLRRLRFQYSGWLLVHGVLLGLVFVGRELWPEMAGAVVAGLWVALVVIPGRGIVLLSVLASREWHRGAWLFSYLLALLHPFDGWRLLPSQYRVLHDLARGRFDAVRSALEQLEARKLKLATFVRLQLFRAEGRWEELRTWVELSFSLEALASDGSTVVLYLRSLAETGDFDSLARANTAFSIVLEVEPFRAYKLFFVAAFTGRRTELEQLLRTELRHLSSDTKNFWRATAAQAAGDSEEADRLFNELAKRADPILQPAAQRRLAKPVATVGLSPQDQPPAVPALIQELAHGLQAEPLRRTSPWATYLFIAINAVVFYYETRGGSTNEANLRSMGALISPPEAEGASWWRVFTAGFLHYGWLHCLMNSLALLVLGRRLEGERGCALLTLVYLGSMWGANAYAYLTRTEPGNLVGASGGVMGVFGAFLAFSLVAWRTQRNKANREIVVGLVAVLALQVLFDSSYEIVAGSVHLVGCFIGLAIAIPFANYRHRQQSDQLAKKG